MVAEQQHRIGRASDRARQRVIRGETRNRKRRITLIGRTRPISVSALVSLLTEIAYPKPFKNGSAVPFGHEQDNAISPTRRIIYRRKVPRAFRPDASRNSLIDPLLFPLPLNGTDETFIDNRII